MGGHAFERKSYHGDPALYCPRMPEKVYYAIRDEVIKRLKTIFKLVEVPLEHPEKMDFGDIDILVCSPQGGLEAKHSIYDLKHDIAKALKATRYWCNKNEVGYFGVRIPKSIIQLGDVVSSKHNADQLGSNDDYYVQIDVEVVDAPSQFDWRVFQNAHSTFCNILRFGLRPAGFVVMNNGLHIRILDIPKSKNGVTAPLIFLSNDVAQILSFLELHKGFYDKRFETCEQYWEYATSASHFSRSRLKPGVGFDDMIDHEVGGLKNAKSTKRKVKKGSVETDEANTGKENCKTENKMLKNGESIRRIVPELAPVVHKKKSNLDGLGGYIGRREPWIKFVNEWLPEHPEIGAATVDPGVIFHEALLFFNAKARYTVQWEAYMNEIQDVQFWETVRAHFDKIIEVKQNNCHVNEIVIALKRWVAFVESQGRGKRPVIVNGHEAMVLKNTRIVRETKIIDRNPVLRFIKDLVLIIWGFLCWVLPKAIEEKPNPPIVETSEENAAKQAMWELEAERRVNTKWLVESAQGGWTKDELMDFILLHGDELRKRERDRTRPNRRAADARRLEDKQRALMTATPVGRAICNTTEAVRDILTFLLLLPAAVENWWKLKQHVRVWTQPKDLDA